MLAPTTALTASSNAVAANNGQLGVSTAGSDGDSMPESPLSLDDDMETECYPCIPMRSAFPLHSQQINPQQIRIKQEDPEDCDGDDDLEDKRPRHILKFTSPTLVTPTVTPSVDARSNVIKKEPMLPTLVYTARPAAAFNTSSNNLQTATAASRLINQVSSQSTTNRVLTTARIARAGGGAATSRHPQSVLKPQPSRGQAVVNNTGDLVHSSSSSPTTTILVSAANGSILTTTTHTGSHAPQQALRQATLSGGAPTVALATTTPSSTLKPFSLVTNRSVGATILTRSTAATAIASPALSSPSSGVVPAAASDLISIKTDPDAAAPLFHTTNATAFTTRSSLTSQLISSQPTDGASGILVLTDEEKKTLLSEGYSVPTKLPLTKAEEKSLKKIRRKIKNKISAQESRRKKKEFVDTLEQRVNMASAEVESYKKRCEVLQKQNASLISQLNNLKALIQKDEELERRRGVRGGGKVVVQPAEATLIEEIKVEPSEVSFDGIEGSNSGIDLD